MSAGHNSPVATSCQYHDYIVPMPYFYYPAANPDQASNPLFNEFFTSSWPAFFLAIYMG